MTRTVWLSIGNIFFNRFSQISCSFLLISPRTANEFPLPFERRQPSGNRSGLNADSCTVSKLHRRSRFSIEHEVLDSSRRRKRVDILEELLLPFLLRFGIAAVFLQLHCQKSADCAAKVIIVHFFFRLRFFPQSRRLNLWGILFFDQGQILRIILS